eukprot:TRINITY_DN6923_c0_g2_i1.p1 TRINITY_DN6923_c0_g2~~TRINITY_DN6923_c0_g2_i1.p1  ORF type:complete len:126 (-),score=37.59 TRINITY_DN6923_c0_g2_i1:4-381(-)
MPKAKGISPNDPDYHEKRIKNNQAIRRSRAKKKAETENMENQVKDLKEENAQLEGKIKQAEGRMDMLKAIIKAHNSKNQDNPNQSAQMPPSFDIGDQGGSGAMDISDLMTFNTSSTPSASSQQGF